jgi:uncharacterized protein
MKIGTAALVALFAVRFANGQTMSIEEYEPKSTLVVPEHKVARAKYPFVDVHNHQDIGMSPEDLDRLVKDMDALNMRVMVNLSGTSGASLAGGVKTAARQPGRVLVFANLDFSGIDAPGWGTRAAAQLGEDVKAGAKGLKIFKNFGMTVKDSRGERIHVDDPRLDPIFEKCAQLKIPVLIHTAEPASFFEPQDRFNERWLELKQFPKRARPPDQYPPWEALIAEQRRLFAREWFIKHQDRVLFGKDTWAPEEYHVYFRVLETADEYFDYYRKRHAFWKMYGLELPDGVLKKLYYKNALRILPSIDASAFPK